MRTFPAIIAAALCGASLTTVWADVGLNSDAMIENISCAIGPEKHQGLA